MKTKMRLCAHLMRNSLTVYQNKTFALLFACFMLISCLAYSSALEMEVTCSSKMPLNSQQTTQFCIPEDRTLHYHFCENLKSCAGQNLFQAKVVDKNETYIIYPICILHKLYGF
jgi:hypothetical protein